MCLFQCKLYYCRNMGMRNSDGSGRDDKILRYIRRENLDMFRARNPSTVYKHFIEIREVIKNVDELGITPPLPERGSMTLQDTRNGGSCIYFEEIITPGYI